MVLISFLRTGGNFLIQKIFHETGTRIVYTHKLIEDDLIINIVRNPIDSMISSISMDQTINFNTKKENYIWYTTMALIPYYKKMYNTLLNSNNKVIFIKYEDLNNELLFDKLYKILNLPVTNHHIDFNFIEKSKLIENYQVTSKPNKNYENIRNSLSDVDFAECLTLYRDALQRCLVI